MPTPAAPWPDTEQIVAEVLADLTDDEPVLVLPEDLQDRLPLQRVRRIGGADDRITDVVRVDVETYAATRAEAVRLAGLAQQRLLAGRTRTRYGLLDRAVTEVSPRPVTHPDQRVRMVRATYRVSVRRRGGRVHLIDP